MSNDTPTLGRIIAGRFAIVGEIGKGGMGKVVEAHNTVTGRSVALKIPRPDLAHNDAFRKRFLREARAASVLSHPNVIDILDVVVDDDDTPIMVMELLEGESLADFLDQAVQLTIAQTASFLVPVFDALRLAHDAGVVHRDFKPENVFLADEPGGGVLPKLLDFGIAKVLEGSKVDAPSGTTTGTMLGTPYYMAPEQVGGLSDIDHRADVWSAAAVTYECLAGARPFEGDNFGQIFTAIIQRSPQPLADLCPEVPPQVVEAIDACFARERDDRPDSLATLIDALAPYVSETVQRTPSLALRAKRGRNIANSEDAFAATQTSDPPPSRKNLENAATVEATTGSGEHEPVLVRPPGFDDADGAGSQATPSSTLGGSHTDRPPPMTETSWLTRGAALAAVAGLGLVVWNLMASDATPAATTLPPASAAPSAVTTTTANVAVASAAPSASAVPKPTPSVATTAPATARAAPAATPRPAGKPRPAKPVAAAPAPQAPTVATAAAPAPSPKPKGKIDVVGLPDDY